MKRASILFAAVAAMLLVNSAFAQESAQKECCPDGQCPIAKAMDQLPKMTYMVGKEETCCNKSAEALAAKSNAPIHFVVAKKNYDNKEKAFTALVTETEKYVNAFITPCKCEASGTTKIAGQSCNCPVEAGKKAELVKAAADKVKMSYVVGKETCNCPNKAAALAKSSDSETHYVVGEQKTCCQMTARLNLAHAKYKAAVQALAAAEKPVMKK